MNAKKTYLNVCNEAAAVKATDFSRMFVPYGDYPIELDDGSIVVQHFTPASATRIAAALANEMKSGKSKGIPIYQGHPDVPALASRYPDKRAYGWITEAKAEAGGMALIAAWNEEPGDHFSHISPYWGVTRKNYEVAALWSVALINNPNIKELRLPNESADGKGEETMNKELLTLLGLGEDADEQAVCAKVQTLKDENASLMMRLEASKAETTTAQTGLANERKARIGIVLDTAIERGQITAAARPAWEARLSNEKEFDAALIALANEKAVKTDGVTKELKKPAASHSDVIAMANEKVQKSGGKVSFIKAYGEVKKEHPEFFGPQK
jgi:hypothetical protein